MDYTRFTAVDLASDEQFVRWVNHPDPESDAFWKSWLTEHPDREPVLEEARQLVRVIHFRTDARAEERTREVWQRIQASRQNLRLAPEPARVRPIPVSWYVRYRVAAGLILLLTVTALLTWVLRQPGGEQYQTAYGEIRSISLPDGSVVMLNANSSLRLAAGWDDRQDREVWLEGEAYFTVTHTRNHQKFIVHTVDGLQVEVLGTEFNVSGRENRAKVVLNSGQVKVSLASQAPGEAILMQPGELVEVSKKQYTKRTVNPDLYSAWTQNRYVLDRTSLREITQMLEDNYGLEIHVADPVLLTQTASGSMPLGDVDQLLDQTSKIFRLEVSRDNNRISIRPNPD